MKELLLNVIPMNCGTYTGLNTIATFDEDEYASATDRKVLFYDPFLSKFKMKSVTLTPYIEPCIIGIKKGDIFEVEFEALSIGGKSVDFNVLAGEIKGDLTTVVRINNILNFSNENYCLFKVRFIITNNFSDTMKGVYLNLRPNTLNSEVLIRNVRIRVKTSNDAIVIDEKFYTYQTKADFENAIVNRMQRKDEYVDYSQTYLNYVNGAITVDETNGMTVNNTVNKFNGLYVEGNYARNPSCHAVYVEYTNNGNTRFKVALGYYRKNKTTGQASANIYHSYYLPTTSTVKKKIVYLPAIQTMATISDFVDYDLLGYFMEVGSTSTDGTFTIKKVIFGDIAHAPTEYQKEKNITLIEQSYWVAKLNAGGFEILTDSQTINNTIPAGQTLTYDYTFPIPFKKRCTFVTACDYGVLVPPGTFSINIHNITKTGCQIIIKNNGSTPASPIVIGLMAIGI